MSKVYMGQIMAECDCEHHGCEMRGYCMAEKIVNLEKKVDEVERRRVKWMNKADEVEAKLAKAVGIAKDAIETMVSGPIFPRQEEKRLLKMLDELEEQ